MLTLLEMLTTECTDLELAQRIEHRLKEEGYVVVESTPSSLGESQIDEINRYFDNAANSLKNLSSVFAEFEGGVSPDDEGGVLRSFNLSYSVKTRQGSTFVYRTIITSDDIKSAVEIGKMEYLENHRHVNVKRIELDSVQEI